MHPSINIPAQREMKNILFFNFGALTQKHAFFLSFLPSEIFSPSCFQPLLLAAFVEVLVSSALPSPSPPPNAHALLLHSHNSAVTWQRGPSWTQHQPCCHGNRMHTCRHGKHVGFFGSRRYMHIKKTPYKYSVLKHP